jgi:alpha-N-arabinofuranosidase
MWNRDDKRHEDKDFYNFLINERNKSDLNSTYTMADAVFSACFLNTCLRNCDLVQMACFSPVVNTRGAIFTHKDGIVLRPQYFVFKLYANLMKQTVLNIWQEGVPTYTGTRAGVEETVDLVDVVVTHGDGSYAVSAINKDPANPQSFDLSVLDASLTEMRIHTVNGPATNSYNDIDRTEVGITVSEWVPFTGSITLDPHSVNVIELR